MYLSENSVTVVCGWCEKQAVKQTTEHTPLCGSNHVFAFESSVVSVSILLTQCDVTECLHRMYVYIGLVCRRQ